jgi:putative transposase
MNETTRSPLGNVITIDDERIKNRLERVVRGSVEKTLNALLDAEAHRLCNAQRYERTEARRDTRAGHYERKLSSSFLFDRPDRAISGDERFLAEG